MNSFAYDKATTRVLWHRDLKMLLHNPRDALVKLAMVAAIWGIVEVGMYGHPNPAFAAASESGTFLPGALLLMLLLATGLATAGLAEERQHGFLRVVLLGPGSRPALVFGKCLGTVQRALPLALILLALTPLAGFHLNPMQLIFVFGILLLGAMMLATWSFLLAWSITSTPRYLILYASLSLLVWFLSGAFFNPPEHAPLLATLMFLNPAFHIVSGLHAVLTPEPAISVLGWAFSVLALLTLVSLCSVMIFCKKQRQVRT